MREIAHLESTCAQSTTTLHTPAGFRYVAIGIHPPAACLLARAHTAGSSKCQGLRMKTASFKIGEFPKSHHGMRLWREEAPMFVMVNDNLMKKPFEELKIFDDLEPIRQN